MYILFRKDMLGETTLSGGVVRARLPMCQYNKTFYVRKLRIFVKGWSVCPLQPSLMLASKAG